MAIVFWDSHGILLIDHLDKGTTITGKYYAALLKLKEEITKKKTAVFEEEKVLIKTVAPSHTSAVAMAKIDELRFELKSCYDCRCQ